MQKRPIAPNTIIKSFAHQRSGTTYVSIKSQKPIQMSTPLVIETNASATASGSK